MNNGDLISRQAAIDALWKALYEYEDKTEKQFQESEDLDVGEWFMHRIFVQNMHDIDIQTILSLPSETYINTSKELLCSVNVNMDTDEVLERLKERGWGPVEHGRWLHKNDNKLHCSKCDNIAPKGYKYNYCQECGARMDGKEE